MSDKGVSVIIPMYKGSATISKCVEAILAQDYSGPIEIIVVDDGSKDDSGDVVKRYLEVKLITQNNAGPAVARNNGARSAQHEFLVFTDSDCVPQKDWISRLMMNFTPQVVAVAGSYGIKNPANRLANCIHKEIRYRHLHRMKDEIKVFGSYNFAIKKDDFFEIGGFCESYHLASGEDNDLAYRLRIRYPDRKIYFAKEALVDHYHPSRLTKYLITQFRHGYWRVYLYRQHPGKVSGDGYTFWKDSLGVLLMCFGCIAAVLGFTVNYFWGLAVIMFVINIVINLYFSFLFLPEKLQRVYYTGVMFLRDFFRMSGAVAGLRHLW